MAKHEPQISFPTAILIGIICALADIADAFSFGIPVGDIIAFPVTQIYLWIKGLKGETMLIGNLIELIPFADYLPIRTVVWCIVVIADRSPKAQTVLEAASVGVSAGQAAKIAKKKELLDKNAQKISGEAIEGSDLAGQSTATKGGPHLTAEAIEEEATREEWKAGKKAAALHLAGLSPEEAGKEGEEEVGELEEKPGAEDEGPLEQLGWGTETRRVIRGLEEPSIKEDIEAEASAATHSRAIDRENKKMA